MSKTKSFCVGAKKPLFIHLLSPSLSTACVHLIFSTGTTAPFMAPAALMKRLPTAG